MILRPMPEFAWTFIPGLSTDIVANSICFQGIGTKLGLMGNWFTCICSDPLTVQKGAMGGNRMWTAGRLALYIISYFILEL